MLLLELIQYAVAFLLALGILVTVHEWGHYWVAKRLGIKILRFSVGFGDPIWSRRLGPDQTEFTLAPIPLGGYVKMLGDDDDVEIAAHEAHRAFNRQSLKVRAAVVVAGPLANFVLAVFFYMLIFMLGTSGIKSLVGEVTAGGLGEKIGLQSGHVIVAVNESPVTTWSQVQQSILANAMDDAEMRIKVQDDKAREYVLYFDTRLLDLNALGKQDAFAQLGIAPYQPHMPAKIIAVVKNGRAEQAGMQAGDEIVAVDGQAVGDWFTAADLIRAKPEQSLQLSLLRGTETIVLTMTPENVNGQGIIGIQAQTVSYPKEYLVMERYGVVEALVMGVKKTGEMTVLIFKMMKKLLTGQISVKNISGPVTIAEFAGTTFQMGLVTYLSFLALISLNLGVVNLLPIPVLDGGHLFLYLIEWLKGGPLSEQSLFVFQRVGLVLIVLLMGLALFNDINRLLE